MRHTITMTPDLLANVIFAAYLSGWNDCDSSAVPDLESADRCAQAFALKRLEQGNIPTDEVSFMSIDDPVKLGSLAARIGFSRS